MIYNAHNFNSHIEDEEFQKQIRAGCILLRRKIYDNPELERYSKDKCEALIERTKED